jgi:hypothetical protein
MARLIGELCDTYLPDQKWPLVGGLVLLRLYSPTLISPTTYGLLPVDYPLSAALRKNLMQVTRLLQNASNHQPFKVSRGEKNKRMSTDGFVLKGRSEYGSQRLG